MGRSPVLLAPQLPLAYNPATRRSIIMSKLKAAVIGVGMGRHHISGYQSHPDVEVVEGDIEKDFLNFKRIVPIYSETEGLHQRTLRRLMKTIIDGFANELSSPLPEDIVRRQRLIEFQEAFRLVHFPPDDERIETLNLQRSPGHLRIIFDEFFFLELGLATKKRGTTLETGISFQPKGLLAQRLIERLPFQLTRAQTRVLEDIRNDMSKPHPMNRLLQGDVGSGKTMVALLACLGAIECGYQTAFMVPTEVLAEQHYMNLKPWMEWAGRKMSKFHWLSLILPSVTQS
jgi:ATP-dependent DNA helicase RecG